MPAELTEPLKPMRRAESIEDVPAAYRHNMQRAAECYIRYQGLVEAVESRNAQVQ